MDKPESKPSPEVPISYTSGDVLGEFVSSAMRSGVERPLKGVAQLAGFEVSAEQDRKLTGAMKYANIAGSGVGVVADLVVLSRFVGKGVGSIAENYPKSFLAENATARSLTTAASTGFIDGAALTPVHANEGLGRRLGNGMTEAAAFATLEGTGRLLSTKAANELFAKAGSGFENAISRIPPISPDANVFMRATQRGAENLVNGLSKIPPGVAEGAIKNSLSGFAGGSAYYSLDTATHGRSASVGEGFSTAFGWAAGNAILGGLARRPSELKQPTSTESLRPAKSEAWLDDAAPPLVIEVPPADWGPVGSRRPRAFDVHTGREYKGSDIPAEVKTDDVKVDQLKLPEPLKNNLQPDIVTAPDGTTRWTYSNLPAKGDRTTYLQSEQSKLTWQIETAGGKLLTPETPGPWQVRYDDGGKLVKGSSGDFQYTRPTTLELNGKSIEATQTVELAPNHKVLSQKWQYADPANPGQTVTFDSNRSWTATRRDGTTFGPNSEGPWSVTSLDGFKESKLAGSTEIDMERIASSSWRHQRQQERHAEPLSSKAPWAMELVAQDASPMSLSSLPSKVWITNGAQ